MKNKKLVLVKKLAVFAVSLLLFYACEDRDDDINIDNNIYSALTGTTWIDTVFVSQDDSYYVDQLTFNDDETFTAKFSSYGIYPDQSKNELSGWFVYTGNYTVSDDSLYFIANQVTSWDLFFNEDPETVHEPQVIFENCNFELHDGLLRLSYITYPADAPEITVRQYQSLDDYISNY